VATTTEEEADERAKGEAEERKAEEKEAEEKNKKEAEEMAEREAEEKNKKEAEEMAKKETKEKAEKEAEVKAVATDITTAVHSLPSPSLALSFFSPCLSLSFLLLSSPLSEISTLHPPFLFLSLKGFLTPSDILLANLNPSLPPPSH
jgi:hypothetical protein